ncbi:MAG: AAA family ATPase [Candidatus Nitrosotenuis sp.]
MFKKFQTADHLVNFRVDTIWEIVTNNLAFDLYERGYNLQNKTRIIDENKEHLNEFIALMQPDRYLFTSTVMMVFIFPESYMTVEINDEIYELTMYGTAEQIAKLEQQIDSRYPINHKYIDWVHDPQDLDSVTLPLTLKPIIEAAFPWLQMPSKDYIEAFIKSEANILILIGPPGTGKTTLIKNIIASNSKQTPAIVTYDEKMMEHDRFFARFMSRDYNFLVVEDADVILKSRSEGNSLMQRFLNLGDGLISTRNKKLIFSTNLPNIRDIDSALLRPGRCFDVLQFRALSSEEGKNVLAEVGRSTDLPFKGNNYTLAELLNGVQTIDYSSTHAARFQ